MISIKGASGQEMVIATEQEGGYRWIIAMGADIYKTADLHAALNVVPAEKARQMVEDERAHCREFQAERDALAKTVERVRAVVTRFLDPHGQDAVVAARVAEKIRAALDPEPTFTLPTEVPARIEAKREGKTYTFYLWTNGHGGSNDLIWVDEDDWTHSPSPRRLMADFTDHRLIGGEA